MTAPFSLVERALTRDEAVRLSAAIRETPNILGYPPKELQTFRHCLIAETDTGAFAGVCILKRLAGSWWDLAVVYVFPEYRGQGIGTALFLAGFRHLQDSGQHILCTSREATILRLMAAQGMCDIPDWRLPLGVHLAKSRHYMLSGYRWREAFRKAPMYHDQPPFRTMVAAPGKGRSDRRSGER